MSIYRMVDLRRFPDCSALTLRGGCTRLTLSMCQGEECSFKRTGEEDINSLKYANERLARLDISKQIQIAKKYYRGSMPWNKVNHKILD